MASVHAQTYINTEWVQSTGEPDNLPWTASVIDGQGDVIVVGNTQVAPGNADVLVTKYDGDGELLWQQTYAGTAGANDYGIAVITNIAGDIFVAATVTNAGSEQDFAILKYDEQGSLQWDALWDGPAGLADVPASMAVDSAGNLYVCGATWANAFTTDYALVKFNASGAYQWEATYDHADLIDAATAVSVDPAGHVVVTGGSASGINSWDYATLRYHGATGAGMDTVRVDLPGVGLDNALAMSIDEVGNIYVTGYRLNGSNQDIQTLKLTNSFELAWVQNYDGAGQADAGQAVAADTWGNVYVAGYMGNSSGGTDFAVLKYGPSGNLLWSKRFRPHTSSWQAQATKMVVATGGGVVVTGSAVDGSTLSYATVRYDANGNVLWSKLHDAGYGDDKALALTMGPTGIYYVSGQTETPSGLTYTTVKYNVYTKDHDAVLDSLGNPLYLEREVIVKFRAHLVDTTFVDNTNMQHTTLDKLVPDSVGQAIAAKLGLPPAYASRLKVLKIFRSWTRADSISISRLGDEVRLPKFWSVFGLESGGMEPVVASDSLWSLWPEIEYAHPNMVFLPQTNDPVYQAGLQAGLAPTDSFPQHHINVEPAWAIQTGQPFIKVGVVDSPVKWDHEDFVMNGASKVVGGKVYGGFPQEPIATSDPFPYSGAEYHGTACASIIGALRNNQTGVAGIAGGDVDGDGNSGASLITLIVGGSSLNMTLNEIAPAITEGAVDIWGSETGFGCHVLNFSIAANPGFGQGYEPPHLLMQALDVAMLNNCVFVAAHGNNCGTNQVNFPSSQPQYNLSNEYSMISVGATGNGTIANPGTLLQAGQGGGVLYSNYGNGVDVVAPGSKSLISVAVGVEITNEPTCGGPNAGPLNCPNEYFDFGNYHCFMATSAATPHVAGVAALMLAEHSMINGAPNGLSTDDVEILLKRTATALPSPYNPWEDTIPPNIWHGYGRINAGAALGSVSDPYCVVHNMLPIAVWDSIHHPIDTISVPIGNSFGLPHGFYRAQRVSVTHIRNEEFPTGSSVHDHWGRLSGTVGTGPSLTVYGLADGDYQFDVDGTSVTVTATTNCWFIENEIYGGPIINGWYPDKPENLRTAYSIHLLNGDCWGPSTVDVEEIPAIAGMKLFPSPTNGMLNVVLDTGQPSSSMWHVRDMLGRVLLSGVMVNERMSLDMSVIAPGTYMFTLSNGEKNFTQRFVKQ